MSPPLPPGLERWQPSPCQSHPWHYLPRLDYIQCPTTLETRSGQVWGNLRPGASQGRLLMSRRFYKTSDNPRLVLTAGLSSDTLRRHRTSPLSLTAHSATLYPFLSASALSGMMDTSLRVMGATSSHGPLVTSLHFLCREMGAWVQCPGVTGSLGTAHHCLLLTQLSLACRS